MSEKKLLWTLRSEKKKRKEVFQTPEQIFPFSPWGGPQQNRCPHCSLRKTTHQSKWIYLEKTAICWEPILEQVLLIGTAACGDGHIFHCSLWRLSHCSRYLHCGPWMTHTGAILFWRTAGHVQDEEKWEEEGAAERNSYVTAITTCSPPFLSHLGQGHRYVESKGVK